MAEKLPVPLIVSAESEAGLRDSAIRLAEHLRAHPELSLLDLAATLQSERPRLRHGAAVLGRERAALIDGLTALGQGEAARGLITARAREPKIAFLFSGQGAQRPGMGEELYAAFPPFAAALDELCAELDPQLERPLREALFAAPGSPEAELLDRTDFTQAALFALEVALYRLLERFGLRPDYLIGHSIGELAAAHVAGAISLADACRLVAARGGLMARLPAGGAMLAVNAPGEQVEASLSDFAGRIGVAALNGPRSTVISGDEDAIEAWSDAWGGQAKTTRLPVSHAFHSPRVEPILDQLTEVAASLDFADPQIPVVSNLTGEPFTERELGSPDYWARQAREPVRFMDGVEFLSESGATQFLELGPAPVLAAMAAECLEDERGDTSPLIGGALSRRGPEPEALLRMLCAAQLHGAPVDLEPLLGAAKAVELPGGY